MPPRTLGPLAPRALQAQLLSPPDPPLLPLEPELAAPPPSISLQPILPMEREVAPQSVGQTLPVELVGSHWSGPQSRWRCMTGVQILPSSVVTPTVKPSVNSLAQA